MRLAVIPARGGSKRIPRKNIRAFLGRPIIAWSIAAARESQLFDHVIVSTDDPEIAAIAKQAGAEVPFTRPTDLSDDYATTAAVVKHATLWYAASDEPADIVCCLYATAPFVTATDLRAGQDLMLSSGKSYAFSVASFSYPVQRALVMTEDGGVAPLFPEHAQTRSQDLPAVYHDAGQFYWGRAAAWLNDVPLFSAASAPLILPAHRVQDIDTLEDWHRAELMMRVWLSENGTGR
jgi:N-acylneuraminate cytidylyltransferase